MNSIFTHFQEFAVQRRFIDLSFLVGGTVRDLLSNKTIHDYDIVIKHDAVNIARAFASEISASLVVLDEDLGIMRVAKAGEFIDICAMRGKTIEDDLFQRDFTINAMALNLAVFKKLTDSGKASFAHYIIDPFNGIKDLSFQIIRMVSEDNLVEDPLRLLRAYRFASVLDFSIHMDTCKAIRKHASDISGVSVERVAEELRHILKVNFSCKTIYDMHNSGLLLGIFPELRDFSLEQLLNAIQRCSCAEHILNKSHIYFPLHEEYFRRYFKDTYRIICLKLALLLYEKSLIEKAALRLKMSGKEIGLLSMISEQIERLLMLKESDKTKKYDFLIQSGDDVYPLLFFCVADEIISQLNATPTLRFGNEMLKIYHSEILPRIKHLPILTGDDLIEKFALKPSPLFSKLLHETKRLFLQGEINSKDEAFNAVAEMLRLERVKGRI